MEVLQLLEQLNVAGRVLESSKKPIDADKLKEHIRREFLICSSFYNPFIIYHVSIAAYVPVTRAKTPT